jgi:hypothetical protein
LHLDDWRYGVRATLDPPIGSGCIV